MREKRNIENKLFNFTIIKCGTVGEGRNNHLELNENTFIGRYLNKT